MYILIIWVLSEVNKMKNKSRIGRFSNTEFQAGFLLGVVETLNEQEELTAKEEEVEELTAEEDGVISELIERAERWDVSDNGIINTISRVVKDKKEEEIVCKLYEWENEQMMLSQAENKETNEGKQEEEAWENAADIKEIRGYKQVNELLNREKRGEVVLPNKNGGFGATGVDREEMLVELEKIAPNHPALKEKAVTGVFYRG